MMGICFKRIEIFNPTIPTEVSFRSGFWRRKQYYYYLQFVPFTDCNRFSAIGLACLDLKSIIGKYYSLYPCLRIVSIAFFRSAIFLMDSSGCWYGAPASNLRYFCHRHSCLIGERTISIQSMIIIMGKIFSIILLLLLLLSNNPSPYTEEMKIEANSRSCNQIRAIVIVFILEVWFKTISMSY